MVFYSTHLLNPQGMWLRVRSAGFTGRCALLLCNSLGFRLILCFPSSSSRGRLETARPAGVKSLSPSLLSQGESAGPSWVTAGWPIPLSRTRSPKAGAGGAGTREMERQGHLPTGGGGTPCWGCPGEGTGLEVRSRARCSRSWTPGPSKGPPARLDLPTGLFPLPGRRRSAHPRGSSVLQPPRLELAIGLPRKIPSPS